MMKISRIALEIQYSLTRKLFDKAQEYTDVVDFTLGDPDYPTPVAIRQAGCAAIQSGKTKYSANAGISELRNTIGKLIYKETGVSYRPDKEIVVTVGAMEALYLSLLCTLNPGDEVIILAPYWVNYCHMVQMCGGKPIIVYTNEQNDFVVDVEDIKKVMTEKTCAIILNSPNNPTGTVYDRKSLEQIAALIKQHDLIVFWDECYKHIVYDAEFVSILEMKDIKDRVVIINSCSKEFSMTGWRIGYAAAPAELVKHMTKLQENIVACATLPSQYAALEAFGNEHPEVKEMQMGFEKRRNILVNGINQIDKLSCKIPKGTFYAFVNIGKSGLGSVDFAYRLLDEKQVAVVPGITYGEKYDNFIRIAYTMNEKQIEEGVRRISEFVKSL